MTNVYANLRLIAAGSRAHQPKKIVLKSDQNIHSQPSRKKEAKNLDNGKETHIINFVRYAKLSLRKSNIIQCNNTLKLKPHQSGE